MKIVLCQMLPALFDKGANVRTIENILKNNEGDLFIFSELFLTGYLIGDENFRLSENTHSTGISTVEKIAEEYGKAIITGLSVEDAPGVVYNCALFTDGNSTVIQKKRHLPNFGPFLEKRYFKEGFKSAVFDYKGFNIGMEICYDLFFSDIMDELQKKDVDLIVNISASPVTSRLSFERVLSSVSINYGVYTVYLNMHGTERWAHFWGGSRVIDPRGNVILRLDEKDIGGIDIELDEVKIGRISRPTGREIRFEGE